MEGSRKDQAVPNDKRGTKENNMGRTDASDTTVPEVSSGGKEPVPEVQPPNETPEVPGEPLDVTEETLGDAKGEQA
jgi:hypothetical protein